ncbi:MAG TPA: 5-(carboxyamino)imidazole ribonucleotide synthase [Chthoniobacterales bacterium]|jgi:5-(carboxyamino)imidazole ribonucleotide synthase
MMPNDPLLPGATIGIMGGGQLGRMFAIAARRMGYHVHTFSPEKNGPAAQFSDLATAASYYDEAAVQGFARCIDVLTFEFENIPSSTVEWASRDQIVRPHGEVLHIAQHRLREKEFLRDAGFPVASFRRVASPADLTSALEAIGRPAILKGAAFGYDGKGQQRIDPGSDLEEVWSRREDELCVLEQVIEFEKEISVIVARAPDESTAVFPVCENIHRHHILDMTLAPARIGDTVASAARALACEVAIRLELVGLLAVEMFLKGDGELIINELAPRPHNSGHWTIEGCVTSQFEQHVRAVCGLPLGSTELLCPTAMVNLLGEIWSDGEPNWSGALAHPGVHLHLYGKQQARPARKMGHLTALGRSVEQAAEISLRARSALRGITNGNKDCGERHA